MSSCLRRRILLCTIGLYRTTCVHASEVLGEAICENDERYDSSDKLMTTCTEYCQDSSGVATSYGATNVAIEPTFAQEELCVQDAQLDCSGSFIDQIEYHFAFLEAELHPFQAVRDAQNAIKDAASRVADEYKYKFVELMEQASGYDASTLQTKSRELSDAFTSAYNEQVPVEDLREKVSALVTVINDNDEKLEAAITGLSDQLDKCAGMVNAKPVNQVCKQRSGGTEFNFCCCRSNALAIFNPNLEGGHCDLPYNSSTPCFSHSTLACVVEDETVDVQQSFDWCFGSQRTENRSSRLVPMTSLNAGHLVLTSTDSSSLEIARVVVNQHKKSHQTSQMLAISHEDGVITCTPDHLLYVDGVRTAARNAHIGSHLLVPGRGAVSVRTIQVELGYIINPVTNKGTILATSKGQPVLATTFSEKLSFFTQSPYVPFPYSMFNAISVCFPNTFQAYYDTLLEPFFDATLFYLVGFEQSVSYPFFIVALVFGDMVVFLTFFLFACASDTILLFGGLVFLFFWKFRSLYQGVKSFQAFSAM